MKSLLELNLNHIRVSGMVISYDTRRNHREDIAPVKKLLDSDEIVMFLSKRLRASEN